MIQLDEKLEFNLFSFHSQSKANPYRKNFCITGSWKFYLIFNPSYVNSIGQ